MVQDGAIVTMADH